nr:MAG TPA: hypothetical protein [Caudoviricetes sp.]
MHSFLIAVGIFFTLSQERTTVADLLQDVSA